MNIRSKANMLQHSTKEHQRVGIDNVDTIEVIRFAKRKFRRYYKFLPILLLAYVGIFFLLKTSLEYYNDSDLSSKIEKRAIEPLHEPELPVVNFTREPWDMVYPYPYKFLMNPQEKCRNRDPFLVLLVVGISYDVDSRMAIRDTWGNEGNFRDVLVVTVFLLGLYPNATRRVQQLLEEENSIYGDIVQQDFIDTYYNLTLKTLMGVEWVSKYCPTASYVMKIDSDMFLNVGFLIHTVLNPGVPLRKDYATGFIVANTAPNREKDSKFYVPLEIYPNDTYPPYFAGPGYVFTADVAQKVYDIAQTIQVIPNEDCFFGICLYHLNITPYTPVPGVFNGHWIDYDRCLYNKLAIVHHYKNDKLREVWKDFWTKKNSGCPD